MRTVLRQHRRAPAALLALLWLASALLPLAHATHGHRYCVEHQSFEELGEGEAAGTPQSHGPTEELHAAPDAERSSVHLACPAPLGAAGHTAPLRPAGLELLAPAPLDARPRAPGHVPGGGVALLRLAPKGSPPRV